MGRSRRRARSLLLVLGLLLLLALLVGVGLWSARPTVPPRADLLLITVDTLRADHLGIYGYAAARTPRLDALGEDGTVFLQAMTPFPRTTPGLASLLTGLWPVHHGSREVAQPMAADVATLAEVLRQHGYRTLGVSANGAASPHQGLDRGFDHFLDYRDLRPPVAEYVTDRTLQLVREHAGQPVREHAGQPVGEHAEADQPLFLWVHYIDPHFPYAPPATWADQPEAPGCRQLIHETLADAWRIAEVQRDHEGASTAVLDECIALYDAEIAYTDAEVGRLLDGLQEARAGRPALRVFTADHGENLGEAGLFFEHGPSIHDAGLHVPLMISGPGLPRGRVDGRTIRLEDLMPSLLRLLGVEHGDWPTMDGIDLSNRLHGWRWVAERTPEPELFAESGSSLLPNTFKWVFTGRAHDLHCFNAPRFSLCGKRGETPKLYDHEADPALQTDVSADHPEIYQAMLAARDSWQPEQVRERALRTHDFKLVEHPRLRGDYHQSLYLPAEDASETRDVKHAFPDVLRALRPQLQAWTDTLPTAAPSGERSQEQIEALRALGYIQ